MIGDPIVSQKCSYIQLEANDSFGFFKIAGYSKGQLKKESAALSQIDTPKSTGINLRIRCITLSSLGLLSSNLLFHFFLSRRSRSGEGYQ